MLVIVMAHKPRIATGFVTVHCQSGYNYYGYTYMYKADTCMVYVLSTKLVCGTLGHDHVDRVALIVNHYDHEMLEPLAIA